MRYAWLLAVLIALPIDSWAQDARYINGRQVLLTTSGERVRLVRTPPQNAGTADGPYWVVSEPEREYVSWSERRVRPSERAAEAAEWRTASVPTYRSLDRAESVVSPQLPTYYRDNRGYPYLIEDGEVRYLVDVGSEPTLGQAYWADEYAQAPSGYRYWVYDSIQEPVVLSPPGVTFTDPYAMPDVTAGPEMSTVVVGGPGVRTTAPREAYMPVSRPSGVREAVVPTGPERQQPVRTARQPDFRVASVDPEPADVSEPETSARRARIIQAEALTVYYSGVTPVYLRYQPAGAGTTCLLEYDYGLNGQTSEMLSTDAAVLNSPQWGRVFVRSQGTDRIQLDLTQVRIPGCSLPSTLTAVRAGQAWRLVR